ncbi:unnamed protein product [Candida verbasci]|uniref:37S ribosomal protein S35, mitochondrial n=1 Tax=Candida verbasci TaxID=1227364 RepID=A0A9W4X8T7_9ASCO|nr:unnamed protein product [Candida verbasci]
MKRNLSTTTRLLRFNRRATMDKANLTKEMKQWLGPKNILGDYVKNPYFYPNQNNKPNYIQTQKKIYGRDSTINPFPLNQYTKTNYIISEDLKDKILEDATNLHPQEIAHKYGINLQRIEAIIKLKSIEKDFKVKDELVEDLKRFSTVMKNYFPLFNHQTVDNLTEIPTKRINDRFLTIEENEPFGPVDAAKILKLEPAETTLKSLTEFNLEDHQKKQQALEDKKVSVVYGKKREGEKSVFRFTQKDVGTFGHRYGASRRDRKKDRAIGFDSLGKMIYLHPNN